MIFRTFFIAILGFSSTTFALSGRSLQTGEPITVNPGSKGTVVLFLSAKCPCSNSHVEPIKKLVAAFGSDFNFVGVHSNTDEDIEASRQYFKDEQLPFPVIQDEKFKLADEFKANKTPHAFIVGTDGKILFKGGVSNSKNIQRADREFLREALLDIQSGHAVRTAEGRTLGCVISRGDKFVW